MQSELPPASGSTLLRDLTAGLVVFLVALPLCLGVALASNAPAFSGLLAGIIGGIVVGVLSGSQTSVAGPAAGLTAIVSAQIAAFGGNFEAFLLAVSVAGLIQIGFGVLRLGILSAFFPSSVIKGLLAAIGVILILKQIPHLLGHDKDPEGEMSFQQQDHENTFSELVHIFDDIHLGASVIGLASIAFLVLWDKCKPLKKSLVPSPLLVVILGVGMQFFFQRLGGALAIGQGHLVDVPVAGNMSQFLQFLKMPDFAQWSNPAVYTAGITIALVASLETLLNLEAVDKLDPQKRVSPPNRELVAQGVGNLLAGLIGGIPVTSVIVRSSVNINAGSQTRLSAITHGLLLFVCVAFFPTYMNQIPVSCLAAILLVTGIKLASPALVREMWSEGRNQFLPFAVTVTAIVLTDLLIGVLIGLGVSIAFILYSNVRKPLRRIVEKHLGGEVLHIELASQVSFLNRASLDRVLNEIPRGGQVLLDARNTDYIDPDVLSMIREFKDSIAPARGIQVSLRGFRDKYQMEDDIQYVDYSTRELQGQVTPAHVLQILKEGNERFRSGHRLTRDLGRQLRATAHGQHPLAVVLSCIDSRTPSELVFDLGLGDIFSVRVAGNVTSAKVLGSMEYGCAVAGAKLIVVMGHTRCGAVTAAVNLACSSQTPEQATGCQHLESIVSDIQESFDESDCRRMERASDSERLAFAEVVMHRNVQRSVQRILEESRTIRDLVAEKRIAVVGAMYDIATGTIEFMPEAEVPPRTLATTQVRSA